MAFLMKMSELQSNVCKTLELADEVKSLFEKEGIGQKDLKNKLTQVSVNLKEAEKEIAKFLIDKQSVIEETEFLTEAFRIEYGTILKYRQYAALIENKEIASHFINFGKSETKHASDLIKLIFERGGTPKHIFKEEKAGESLKKEGIMKALIKSEKETIAFYENGLKKFGDAEFAWLIRNIKIEEAEHLKELKKLEKEFQEKEIVLRYDPQFKWVDPYMGEAGDRAWIE
ncbi:MAG TPA: ferritin-like domain-containing protein [Nitrospinota bacterium]|nr:ferritin-like domain-containing protein [Nitrospinota bacterium]